ncbi:GNAT family N-acetyltransferase [Phaeobacter inhibens]|uniref:GNAT family N-acetyltransferase n=1 Tax=Phaeobacter inhibens TaxID=221822 RepID=UPI000971BC52|nr:GNAT family N-acetyltransferase [Phaeobacter inhibens]APX17493.1 GNAT family N-acetyltransferase [Phaeobacter inhibens]
MRSPTSYCLEPAAIPHLFIRPMDSVAEIDLVATCYRDAPDYWLLVEGVLPGRDKAERFFTDGPPGCDPAQSYRLGLFLEGRLSGLAELSFGFPEPQDAYLGLMVLGPWAQGAGYGRRFLAHVEGLARERGAAQTFLAVVEANARGRAFWEREGFKPTGVSGKMQFGQCHHRLHRLVKPL